MRYSSKLDNNNFGWFIFKVIESSEYSLKDYKGFWEKLIYTSDEKKEMVKNTLSTYAIDNFDWDEVLSLITIVVKASQK